jgi:DNA repair protein RadC
LSLVPVGAGVYGPPLFMMPRIGKISAWPIEERPRERLLRHGATALSDAQLIAIVMRTGHCQQTAVDLAMRILSAHGGLSGLSELTGTELQRVAGIGPAKAAQLLAALELGRRSGCRPLPTGTTITSSRLVFEHFAPRFRDVKQEMFHVVLLDNKHRVLRDLPVSAGSLTMSLVHPREAFVPAVRNSAAAVIFLHNHPSGDPAPSLEDGQLTDRLTACGQLLGIPVLDHLILGRTTYYSFADQGRLCRE